MKKRKILLGLALAAAAVFSLSACGDEDKPADPIVDGGDGGKEVTPDPVKKNYTVNFYSNGGTAVASQTVVEGNKATSPTAPTKTGSVNTYTFGGWYTDVALTKAFDFNTAISGDVTLYAKWNSTLVEASKITMNGTEYASITAALAAIPTSGDTATYTIILPKGTYEENGLAYNGSATVKIVGATDAKYGADVIIKGHGSDMTQEKTRNLISVQGTGNIILENVTLESDWTRDGAAAAGMGSNTQAEVLGTDTKGNTVAYNCAFKSHQDTLRTAGKAWFYGCYIEGDTDFIWMEQAGSVALYEKCEIVSVYDSQANTHASYVTAPRMAISSKAGKGLVIYNSTVKESDEAKEKGQQTYLARSPWTSGYFSQVAYINTTCSDIESGVWYKTPIPSEYDRKVIGWKMDKATATTLNYKGDDILDDATVAKEFAGRRNILNRVFNGGKLKYEKDSTVWDIDALITDNGFTVDMDSSNITFDDETAGEPVTYLFDGSVDQTALCDGFALENNKTHYRGAAGNTITIPVSGKCYVEVYGYYAGTVETKADTQGEAVMFFNNGSTSSEVLNTYAVYDANAKTVTITAKATTYITKVVVTPDSGVKDTKVTDVAVTASTSLECVGVGLTLKATVGPGDATNKSVKWSSSDTEVGEIDAYTGRVTFKKEGTVTFTATATDGSGKSASITCNPVDPKWTQCEWYTTDSTIAAEPGVKGDDEVTRYAASGIENFSFGANTAYKSMGATFKLTNLAGEEISTTNGLKLDSKGELIVATTKSNATLTVIVAHINKIKATPSVKNGSGTAAELLSSVDNADNTTTYVYSLATAGTWSVTRGDGQSENDPILYAKCVYETKIKKNTFVNFKGGTYHATNTDAVSLNHNNPENGVKLETTDKATYDLVTYEGAKSNGNDNWLNFPKDATVKFTVADKCLLYVYFYNGQNNAVVTLNGTAVETITSATGANASTKYVYVLENAGDVVITAASNGYIGAFEADFTTEAPTPSSGEGESQSDTFEENAEIDFSTSTALAASLQNSKVTYAEGFTYNDHTDSIQLQSATSNFSFKVKAGATVTVTSFGSGYGYLLIDGVSNNSEVTYTKTYDADATVTIAAENSEATGGWSKSYLKKIEITYPAPSDTFEENAEIDFSTSTALAASLQNSKVTYAEGFTYNDHTDSIQLQSATSNFSFKVKAGATVTVTSFGSGYGYLLIDGVSNNSEVTYTKTYDADATVTIAAENSEATGGWSKSYLKKIEITYNAEA